MGNGPGVAGIDPVVYRLCTLVVTALCFKDDLIFGNELLHCLGFSEARFGLAPAITPFSCLQSPCFHHGWASCQ